MGREKEPSNDISPTGGPLGRSPLGDRSTGAGAKADADGLATGIPDLLRRAMALGLSGLFTTEEAIRKALGDTLPRDWVDFAAEQSERTRSEFTLRMTEEFGRVMEKVELVDLMERLLEGRTIEVTAQIRLGERAPRDPAQPEGRNGGSGVRRKPPATEESGG